MRNRYRFNRYKDFKDGKFYLGGEVVVKVSDDWDSLSELDKVDRDFERYREEKGRRQEERRREIGRAGEERRQERERQQEQNKPIMSYSAFPSSSSSSSFAPSSSTFVDRSRVDMQPFVTQINEGRRQQEIQQRQAEEDNKYYLYDSPDVERQKMIQSNRDAGMSPYQAVMQTNYVEQVKHQDRRQQQYLHNMSSSRLGHLLDAVEMGSEMYGAGVMAKAGLKMAGRTLNKTINNVNDYFRYRNYPDVIRAQPAMANGKPTLSVNREGFVEGLTGGKSGNNLFFNTTTDQKVTSHGPNNWRHDDVFVINPKSLKGSKILTADPTDQIFISESIPVNIKPKDITVITGNRDAVRQYKEMGFNVRTSDELKKIYSENLNKYNAIPDSKFKQSIRDEVS